MNEEILITEAVPADAAGLLAYLKQAGAETDNLTFGAEGLPFTVESEAEYIAATHKAPGSYMVVAKCGGRIVGDASFAAQTRTRLCHRGEVGLAVLKDCWNQGVGTRLMQAVLDYARRAGTELVTLEVRSDNAAAIHLYKKFGFVKTGSYPGFLKINGQWVDFDLMCLDLRAAPAKEILC